MGIWAIFTSLLPGWKNVSSCPAPCICLTNSFNRNKAVVPKPAWKDGKKHIHEDFHPV